MRGRVGGVFAFGWTIAAGVAAPAWADGVTERVSVGPGGRQGNFDSFSAGISADGRFVAFRSFATNLVPGDTNFVIDVFVRDRRTGRTERVSVGPGGKQGNSESFGEAISADGRFVAFLSSATNLVRGDRNSVQNVFVRDRATGRTERVSAGPGGVQGNGSSGVPTLSANGRFVAFPSDATNLVRRDTNNQQDVFVHDRETGRTERVNLGPGGAQANGFSLAPAISADGRLVAFESEASNLVPGDTNGFRDVFVRDRRTGRTERVSVGTGGVQGNGGTTSVVEISADGRFVAFSSVATNLVPGDTNGFRDVFIRDRRTGETVRVSVGSGGVQGDGDSDGGPISADGRFVAFTSDASNLVPGDTNGEVDGFVRDLETGETVRVTVGRGGAQGNQGSFVGALSADGRVVAFVSGATNLVRRDTNGEQDVFVRTR